MSDKRYEANIIRATAVEPANNLQTTSAPGVWSIDEVVELQKKNKWPTVGNVTTDVTEVFSTFLYNGNGGAQVIENGIALGNAFEGGSVDFSANSTTRIALPASSDFGFGTGDWTIEYFTFIKDNANYLEHIDFRTSSQDSTHTVPIIYSDSSGTLYFFHSSNNRITSSSGALSEGVFYHIAVAKSGSTTKMFINGTQTGSDYTDNNDYAAPANAWSIGGSLEQNNYNLKGYMSNVRIVKGTALYTSNFTAPTSALTAVTNTKLLTLQGSTPFVDNSGNSHTITQNGSPIAFDFGPFTGSSGEGGMVWFKQRDASRDHGLFDTARGTGKYLVSNDTAAEATTTTMLTAFNSNGFTLGGGGAIVNNNANEYVSWTFRKAPKFFDVVTYTGDGNDGRTISHSLGSTPGMIIVARRDSTNYWRVWHRSQTGNYANLYDAGAFASDSASSGVFNNYSGNSSTFTAGININANSATYVAYLFAHNNNDGGFGPDQDADIIKCGSYTGNTSGTEVNLGFEPQFVMIKKSSASESWYVYDSMRGVVTGGANSQDKKLLWNSANAESAVASPIIAFSANGFILESTDNEINGSGTYIYMAIRRGPLAAPTDATKVFGVNYTYTYDVNGATGGSSAQLLGYLGEPADLNITGYRSGSSNNAAVFDRLRNNQYLITNTTSAESSVSGEFWDNMAGFREVASGQDTTMISWTWKRAPSYFDMVAWTGTGSNMNISHNLGVVPEMIWARPRSYADNWSVFHKDLTYNVRLNDNSAMGTGQVFGTLTSSVMPTASGSIHASGQTYIAYLFATVAGVSKVGSYTGSSSAVNVDCGFTSGARFILIKRTSASGDGWFTFDSVRGIVAGNDPFLYLNDTQSEFTSYDAIDPYDAGFTVTTALAGLNTNGSTYIFYAIA